LVNFATMVYRFKIWFENNDEVIRWIDIKPSQTFLDFHNAIQDAIGFDKKELASFYISDSKWKRLFEIMLEDMTDGDDNEDALPVVTMNQAKLRDYINDPHQRFIYVTDYLANWTLLIELLSIEESSKDLIYPRLFRSEGKAPRQREDSKFKMLDDGEFDVLAAKILASKGIQNELNQEFSALETDAIDEDEDDEFGVDDEMEDDLGYEDEIRE
jgi:hypothetical protein